MRKFKAIAAGITAAAAAVALTACSSSSGGGTTNTPPGAESGSTTPAGTSSSPTGGKHYSIGISVPNMQNSALKTGVLGVEAQAKLNGASVEIADANENPATQVTQLKRFVDEGKDAIIVNQAMLQAAVGPVLKQAQAKGIKVFLNEWSLNASDLAAAPPAPVDGQVILDRTGEGTDQVALARQALGSTPIKAIYIGLPFPVIGVDTSFAGIKAALGADGKIVAQVANPTDNADGARGPLLGALTAHSDANVIFTYNGPSAQGAVSAVQAAGRAGKVFIITAQLDDSSVADIKNGTVYGGEDVLSWTEGKYMANLADAAVQGKPESEWRKTVVVKAVRITKDNTSDWDTSIQ